MRRWGCLYGDSRLRSWIAPVDCARGLRPCCETWQRARSGLGETRVNYASADPANCSSTLRLVMWSGHIGISANLTISH